jgi:membrane-associated phospholipid phosphatase
MPVLGISSFQEADIAALKYVNLQRDSLLISSFVCITDSASIACIVTLIVLLSVKRWRSLLPYFILSFLVAVCLSSSLKWTVLRVRPFVTYHFINKLAGGGSPSFPSGHTSDAFMLAAAISLVARRWYVTMGIYLWAVLVAYSRMCLGVHYPSDVLAGITTGSTAAILCFREKLFNLFPHPPSQQARQYQEQ